MENGPTTLVKAFEQSRASVPEDSLGISAEEWRDLHKGALNWQRVDMIVVAIGFVVLGISGILASVSPNSGFVPGTPETVSWLVVELFAVFFIVRYLRKSSAKLNLEKWVKAMDSLRDKQVRKCESLDVFVGSLSNIRSFFVSWAETKVNTPLADYYTRRLAKEIEVFFSVASELLYREWPESQEVDDQTPEKTKDLSFRQVERWVMDICLHVVRNRKGLWRSEAQYYTLLYVVAAKNRNLRKYNDRLYDVYRENVEDFLRRREERKTSRRGSLYSVAKDLGIAVIPVIVTALLIGLS